MAFNICATANWTSLSSSAGMPNGRHLPSPLGRSLRPLRELLLSAIGKNNSAGSVRSAAGRVRQTGAVGLAVLSLLWPAGRLARGFPSLLRPRFPLQAAMSRGPLDSNRPLLAGVAPSYYESI